MTSSENDSVEPIHLIVRSQKGLEIFEEHPKTGKHSPLTKNPIECLETDVLYSHNGLLLAIPTSNGVEIRDTTNNYNIITILPLPKVKKLYFSPNDNFLVTYHLKTHKDPLGNLCLWKIYENDIDIKNDKRSPIYRFMLNDYQQEAPPLTFSSDELLMSRVIKNALLLLNPFKLEFEKNQKPKNSVVTRQDVPNVYQCSIAPHIDRSRNRRNNNNNNNNNNKLQEMYHLALFVLGTNKGKAAAIEIYEFKPSKKIFNRLLNRSFYTNKVEDDCRLTWNTDGTSLLGLVSHAVDNSGKSYYGNSQLFCLTAKSRTNAQIPISQTSGLKDVRWHPKDNKHFYLIDDHPSKLSCFNYKASCEGSIIKDLPRNIIRFNKEGNYLWLGGFGNLNGEMSFYYNKNIGQNENWELIGCNKDNGCRYYEWSPNSYSFICARLYAYRKVDNGYKIYKYNGQLLENKKFDRLHQVQYRPFNNKYFKCREPSPNGRKTANKKVQKVTAYVPPHLRKKNNNNNNNRKNNNNNNKNKNKNKNKNNNNNNNNNNRQNNRQNNQQNNNQQQISNNSSMNSTPNSTKRKRKRKRKNNTNQNQNNQNN